MSDREILSYIQVVLLLFGISFGLKGAILFTAINVLQTADRG